MITEIAQIDVKPGSEKDFEAAVAKARAAFGRAKGFHGFELHRSENFTEWRGLVGQYFAAPPEVEHTQTVLTSAT